MGCLGVFVYAMVFLAPPSFSLLSKKDRARDFYGRDIGGSTISTLHRSSAREHRLLFVRSLKKADPVIHSATPLMSRNSSIMFTLHRAQYSKSSARPLGGRG